MSPNTTGRQPLEAKKVALLERLVELTGRQLLLVNLDGLEPLLDEKDQVIQQMQALDKALAPFAGQPASPEQQNMARLLATLLENEKAMEERMELARQALGQEIKTMDQQSKLRNYLEGGAKKQGRVNITK